MRQAPAIYAYTWAWGETGKCCADHQFELQQKAEQLARTISFVPLDAGIAPAVERDERIGYNAKILTLEEELAASRALGLGVVHREHQACPRRGVY